MSMLSRLVVDGPRPASWTSWCCPWEELISQDTTAARRAQGQTWLLHLLHTPSPSPHLPRRVCCDGGARGLLRPGS